MRKHLSTILIILVFLTGLSLLLYPSISDYINSKNQSRAITEYADSVSKLTEEEHKNMWQQAMKYNEELASHETNWKLSDSERKTYEDILNVNNNGMMGYIEIPKIKSSLPIYHGTDEGVLQRNIGHLQGSSLPVGGENSHCVLSGHRGLPSAKLFSELDKLSEGDQFMLSVLGETLTYEVDQILIVLPDEMDALQIEKGKDLCTLVTCTPYGVNSHRLLVRGHRVENGATSGQAHVIADAIQIEPVIVAPFMALPVLIILVIWVLIRSRKTKK